MNAPPSPPPTPGELHDLDSETAAARLSHLPDAEIADLLRAIGPGRALALLDRFGAERRQRIAQSAGALTDAQWRENRHWPEGSVGRLMEHAPGVLRADTRVDVAIAQLRPLVARTLVTYVFTIDADDRLVGVVAFRELLFAEPHQTLAEIMLTRPFALHPETRVIDAMREIVHRHYPAYPVCDAEGRLLGLVRGAVLFEEQAHEISAQAGAMVGVEKEERTTTPWPRSLRFRQPWLQLNLLTTFLTASVVGSFQDTINHVVLLAVFLPVLSDQCNNTGCQALAVTLRGMTFGELRDGRAWRVAAKEVLLGLLNGAMTGAVAGLAMFALATHQQHAHALRLALITFAAMAGSCAVAGIVGAGVPMILRRLGADPATASSIFLTKATDIVSLGLFLGLATWLVAA